MILTFLYKRGVMIHCQWDLSFCQTPWKNSTYLYSLVNTGISVAKGATIRDNSATMRKRLFSTKLID